MRRLFSAALMLTLLGGAVALSGGQKPATGELKVEQEAHNPWTNLDLNNAPDTFHFAVIGDRTGGHRAEVFSRAVDQLNLMQPAFVVCVGDLIEGAANKETLAAQWKEFNGYVAKLQMPFFYVPGDHDAGNAEGLKSWQEALGQRYYHFLYKDVLFLALQADDPFVEKNAEAGHLSKEQLEYFRKVLAANPNPRWTIVLVHKPMWTQDNLTKNNWLDFEKMLEGRRYTVFAGHEHRYQKFVRDGMNYYQLATTGGSSLLRGASFGEVDHVAWITMKKDAPPAFANLVLEGVYPENMKRIVSTEKAAPAKDGPPNAPINGNP